MNTNEELKTKPEALTIFLRYHKMNWVHEDVEDYGILTFKKFNKFWTTHVEPLQAKLDKSESENQKLRDLLKDAHETLIIASLIDKSNTCRDSVARIEAFLKTNP